MKIRNDMRNLAIGHCAKCKLENVMIQSLRVAGITTAILAAMEIYTHMHRTLSWKEILFRIVLLVLLNITLIYWLTRSILHYPHEPPPRTMYVIKVIAWAALLMAMGISIGAIVVWSLAV